MWEFRVDAEEAESYTVGDSVDVSLFNEGQKVDVKGTSIGKGFTGVMKRYGFGGGRATHGNSKAHRKPGSIGQNQTPSRVFPGKKMAGHSGNATRVQQNLEIVKVDSERKLLLIKDQFQARGNRTSSLRKPLNRNPNLYLEQEPKMEIEVLDKEGNRQKSIEVSSANFDAEFNSALVHQVVVAYRAAFRAGTHAQKNRSRVRGGGAKPYRQKGTGRARAGTRNSPINRGGGQTFAASPRDYSKKVNRKAFGQQCVRHCRKRLEEIT